MIGLPAAVTIPTQTELPENAEHAGQVCKDAFKQALFLQRPMGCGRTKSRSWLPCAETFNALSPLYFVSQESFERPEQKAPS